MNDYEPFIVALTVFGVGGLALGGFLSFLWTAPGALSPAGRRARLVITIGLPIWCAIAVATGYFVELSLPIFVPFAAIPIAAALLLSLREDVAEVLARIPTHWMIWLQTYRMAGAIFLFMYFASGSLSEGFALNAGWGDVLTGALAIPVAMMVTRRTPYHGAALIVWSMIGIGDLILAPVSAQIYGAEGLVAFPTNLIPLFLGPPFGVVMHVLTLRIHFLHQRDAAMA